MKLVLNNWSGGQVEGEVKKEEGTFYSSYGIDLYRDPGFLKPSFRQVDISTAPYATDINAMIKDIAVYNGKGYLLGYGDRIWGLSDVVSNIFYNNSAGFDSGGVGHGYHDWGTGHGESLVIYPTKIEGEADGEAVDKLFFFYSNSTHTGGAFGMYDLTDTFDDDWGSTVLWEWKICW